MNEEITTDPIEEETEENTPTGRGIDHIAGLLEAAIYISEDPMNIRQMITLTGEKKKSVDEAIEKLTGSYNSGQRGLRLVETAGGYRFETDPVFGLELKSYFGAKDSSKLSRAAMETLAIVAYKQPVTIPEINEIRSVDSSGVMNKLLQKKLVRMLGRKEVLGRPLLYGTTKTFLARFSLNSIDDLPSFDEFVEVLGIEDQKSNIEQEFAEHLSPSNEEPVEEIVSGTEDET